MKAKRAAKAAKDGKGEGDVGEDDNKGPTDLLAADDDEDVIF